MKRKYMIGFICILLCSMAVAGCVWWCAGKKNTDALPHTETITIKNIIDNSAQYGVSYIDVPSEMMDGTRYYFYKNGKIYHFNALWMDASYNRLFSVSSYDMQTHKFDKTEIDFSSIDKGDFIMLGVAPYLDDSFVTLLLDRDRPQEKGELYQAYLVELASDYKVTRYESILYEHGFCQITADARGNIALAGENDHSIRIYDKDFSFVLNEESPTGEIYSFIGNAGGKLAIAFPDLTNQSASAQTYYGLYDWEKEEIEYVSISENVLARNTSSVDANSNTLSYIDGEHNVCTYNVGDDCVTKIVSLLRYGIEVKQMFPIVKVEDDSFVYPIVNTETDTGVSEICQWVLISKNATDARKQISFAVTGDYPRKAVSEFNRNNSSFYIDVWDYSDEDGLERMEKEIISGKIPDIIDTSNIDIEEYVKKGLLCDISEYASDFGILPWLQKTMMIQDKLYDLPYKYKLVCMESDVALLPNVTEYSIDEINKVMSECGVNYLVDGMLGADLIIDIIRGNEQYYLSATDMAFTTHEFVDLLKLVQKYCFSEKSFAANIDKLVYESFEDGDYLFRYDQIVALTMISDFYMEDSCVVTGITLGKETAPTINPTCTVALTTSCEYPEVFKQFFSLVYGEEMVDMPVTDQQLTYYFEEQDNLSEQEQEYIYEFLDSSSESNAWRNKCGYESIIREEVEQMIDQSLSPEFVAEKIQTRMNIYIYENE